MRTVKPKPPMPSTKKYSRLNHQQLPPTGRIPAAKRTPKVKMSQEIQQGRAEA